MPERAHPAAAQSLSGPAELARRRSRAPRCAGRPRSSEIRRPTARLGAGRGHQRRRSSTSASRAPRRRSNAGRACPRPSAPRARARRPTLLEAAHRRSSSSLIVREGGRTYADAVAEVREAADFCRYYALQATTALRRASLLPGPAGERNELRLHGRGVFACISPWNFPLAIFTGQVAAALAAGNTVIAKPAEQTPRIGFRAVEILHEAGIPADAAVAAWSATAKRVGAPLVADPRIAGVAFTGSVETAQAHQRRARRARRPDRAADRRDRRRQRDAGRLLRAARAGGGRRGRLGVPERRASAARRSASCSSTKALRRARDAPARRRARRAQGRRSRRARHRHRADHRRAGARSASRAHVEKLRSAARG